MKSPQFKAILMIVLIFGGLGIYLSGGLSKIPNIKKLFSFEERPAHRKKTDVPKDSKRGKVIDSYKGVKVYYNGHVGNVSGRNTTRDGYNLGLKYQCVEFAKRFYYEAHKHKMPDSYGHAKDFFDLSIPQGGYNKARGMYQYRNGGPEPPRPDDLVIIGGSSKNKFGHLFIVTEVTDGAVEFIQQNPGAGNPSRGRFPLKYENGNYSIDADYIGGWLRIQ